MKKAILLLFAVVFLASNAFAAYCDIVPQDQDCVCRQITETDQLGNVISFEELDDIVSGSAWINLYCESSGGTMRQKRTGFEIIKPECVERFDFIEYQSVSNNLCRSCPDPKLIGGWKVRQCFGSKTVMEREVIAKLFTPEVNDCEKEPYRHFIELKVEEDGICSAPGGSILLGLTQNWIAVTALMLFGFGAVIYIILKRKK